MSMPRAIETAGCSRVPAPATLPSVAETNTHWATPPADPPIASDPPDVPDVPPAPARDEPADPPPPAEPPCPPLPVPPATGVTSPHANAKPASAIVSQARSRFIGVRHASAERRRFMKRPDRALNEPIKYY